MKKIFHILDYKHRLKFLFLISLMVVASLLEMLGISIIIPTLMSLSDENFFEKYSFLAPINSYLGFPSNEKLVLISALFLGFVYLLKNVYMLLFYWIESRFLSSVIEKVSQNLLKTYLNQPFKFHLETNSSILVTRFRSDLPSFRSSLIAFSTIFTEGFILLGITIFLAIFNTGVFFIVFSFVFLISLIFYLFFKKTFKKLGFERQVNETNRSKSIQESFGAIKEIKISNIEGMFVNSYNILSNKLMKNFASINFLQYLPRIFFELIAVAILIGIIFFSTYDANLSSSILPVVGVFVGAAFKFLPAANRIISSFNRIKYSMRSIDLLKKDLDLKKEIKDLNQITDFAKINLKNVNFDYEKKEIIKDCNLTINKGDKVFVYGDTGSGKSTLIDLLLGLKEISKGEIYFDETDFSNKNFSLSKIVGYVPQSVFLFDNSIKNNITLFDLNHDNRKLNYCLNIAKLSKFINNLDEKLETFVGQNGIKISGGQKQRLGIAREIYKDPKIFIFDEATNALDEETEDDLIKNFLKIIEKKTFIMISHNLKLSRYFNKKLKLVDGKLNESK